MLSRLPAVAVLAASLVVAGCDGTPDLTKALAVTDVLTGWYDNGVKDGQNHLLPSITYRLKNASDQSIYGVQLTVAFWREGEDGEWNSREVTGIGGTPLPAGQSTDSITVRASFGHTTEMARAEIFTNSLYKDVVVKMFAKRGGRIFAIGEFKVDRRIIPQSMKNTGRP